MKKKTQKCANKVSKQQQKKKSQTIIDAAIFKRKKGHWAGQTSERMSDQNVQNSDLRKQHVENALRKNTKQSKNNEGTYGVFK